MGILGSVGKKYAGLVPRCFERIFEYIEQDSKDCKWTCTISFLQIYMEMVQDLLNPGADNLPLRESQQRGVFVENLTHARVNNLEEADKIIMEGLKNRAMAPTLMNTTSSRAHTILALKLVRTDEKMTRT